MHSRSFHVTVYRSEKQRGFDPEREHGLTYPGENGRMPTDIGADSLLVSQRRQPEVIYSLHYRPHRCELIVSRYEVLKCGAKKEVYLFIRV